MNHSIEARKKVLQKVFGDFRKDGERISYHSQIPTEELPLFISVVELMMGGLEYQKLHNTKECFVKEDLNKFYSKTRTAYRSGKRYTFKEWISVMVEIMDELN